MAQLVFKKIQPATGDPVADRLMRQVQDNVEDALRDVFNNPLLSGRLLESVDIAASATTINHNLGRVPRGWLVVSPLTAATVHQTAVPTKISLFLQGSVAVTAHLFVF